MSKDVKKESASPAPRRAPQIIKGIGNAPRIKIKQGKKPAPPTPPAPPAAS